MSEPDHRPAIDVAQQLAASAAAASDGQENSAVTVQPAQPAARASASSSSLPLSLEVAARHVSAPSVNPELLQQFEPDAARRRHVVVLYVGGTLGMRLNAKKSLEPQKGFLTSEMKQMSELKDPSMPTFTIVEYDSLMDSSDMGPEEWMIIARDIETRYHDGDGFLVAHGTDTMHYTACALSFLLHNLTKPIIITGAMIPFAEPYNDARRNLIVSMMFAASPDIHEVCLYFNDVLLRGNRALKARHTVAAFMSPNYPPLASLEAHQISLNKDLLLPSATGPLSIESNMQARVLSILLHSEYDLGALEALLPEDAGGERAAADAGGSSGAAEASSSRAPHIDAITIEVSGFGSAESAFTRSVVHLVQRAERSGTVVIITNHDINGPLHSNAVVRLSRWLPDVVCIHDMTTECAVVKAMYLFGRGMTPEEVKQWLPRNIRGELSPQHTSSHL